MAISNASLSLPRASFLSCIIIEKGYILASDGSSLCTYTKFSYPFMSTFSILGRSQLVHETLEDIAGYS